MPSWPGDDNKGERARIAHELDRRTFWKECFLVSLKNPCKCDIDVDAATVDADAALALFEAKFPPLCGSL